MPPVPVLVFLLALALCIRLLLSGLRGTTIHTPPWCAKCRFDLSGLTNPPRCPECGADLERLGAIRRTRTVRRRARLIVGALGTLIGAFILVHDSLPATLTVNWLRFAPSSTLSNWVKTAPAPDADRAVAELQRRQTVKRLTPASDGGLRAALLARITNQNAEWTEEMHNHLWAEYSNALMSTAESSAYEQAGAAAFTTIARPKVQVGQAIPAKLVLKGWRAGENIGINNASLWYQFRSRVTAVRRDRQPIDFKPPPTDDNWTSAIAQRNASQSVPLVLPIATTPGIYEIDIQIEMGAAPAPSGSSPAQSWPITRTVEVQVVDGPTSKPRAVDLDTETRLRFGMRIAGVVLVPATPRNRAEVDASQDVEVRLYIYCDRQSLPVSFKAVIRPVINTTGKTLDDQEAGSFAWGTPGDALIGRSSHVTNQQWRSLALAQFEAHGRSGDPRDPQVIPGLKVDVILTPDPQEAEHTIQIMQYPNCEIIFRGIPVHVEQTNLWHNAPKDSNAHEVTIRALDPAPSQNP